MKNLLYLLIVLSVVYNCGSDYEDPALLALEDDYGDWAKSEFEDDNGDLILDDDFDDLSLDDDFDDLSLDDDFDDLSLDDDFDDLSLDDDFEDLSLDDDIVYRDKRGGFYKDSDIDGLYRQYYNFDPNYATRKDVERWVKHYGIEESILHYFEHIGAISIGNKTTTAQSSNSNYSKRSQSSSKSVKSSCGSCNGSGKCFECSRKQRINYKDNRGSHKVREEVRLGYIVCSQCNGDGINDSYPSVGEPCYVSSCNNGWIKCRKCHSSGDCDRCHGKGTRD